LLYLIAIRINDMSLFIEVSTHSTYHDRKVNNVLVSLDKIVSIHGVDAYDFEGCTLKLTDGTELIVSDTYSKFADQYSIRKVTAEEIKKRFPKAGEVPHHPV
jgi:hypothetical protein